MLIKSLIGSGSVKRIYTKYIVKYSNEIDIADEVGEKSVS